MWGAIVTIFNTLIFEPLVNLLATVLFVVPGDSLGLAVIIVVVLVRLILFFPSARAQKKQLLLQAKLAAMRPELKRIQKKHKSDRAAQAQAQMELYKQHGLSPLSPFGTMFFFLFTQVPIFLGLYRLFLAEVNGRDISAFLYSFTPNPDAVQNVFLGMNLTEPVVVLALAAGVAQFLQARSLSAATKPKDGAQESGEADLQASVNSSMKYVFPVLIVGWGLFLPGGLTLYWAVNSLFSVGQQYIIQRSIDKDSE